MIGKMHDTDSLCKEIVSYIIEEVLVSNLKYTYILAYLIQLLVSL